MDFAVRIDQPDLGNPSASRRLAFGSRLGPAFSILNGAGNGYEGGSDAPELSLKWLPSGAADYHTEGRTYRLSGSTQLLLNRGQSYRLNMRGSSESFVLFLPRTMADRAWRAHAGRAESLPEIPTAAASSPPHLQMRVANLRAESRALVPDSERLRELCCAVLADIMSLVALRRGQATRVPAAKRSTREELLRRLLRAEAYLSDVAADATLAGAADAAALSPFHLIRLFDVVFGDTPLAYGARLRLGRAQAELLSTRKSIADIAEAAGYTSRTAFDRAFFRLFRMTPGAVRASGS